MNKLLPIVIVVFIVLLNSCNTDKPKNKPTPDTASNKEDTIHALEHVNYDSLNGQLIFFYLNHKEIPQVCKDIYAGRRRASDDSEVLALLDSLFTRNTETQPFYFLVLTKTMPTADGAYAEPLGTIAKNYVEQRLKQFLNHFINESLLTDSDLNEWAHEISDEIQMYDDVKKETKRMIDKMEKNCDECDIKQKELLDNFIKRVEENIN